MAEAVQKTGAGTDAHTLKKLTGKVTRCSEICDTRCDN